MMRAVKIIFGTIIWTAALLVTVYVGINASVILRETLNYRQAAPEQGRLVKAADADIFVQEKGLSTGPAVIFIHGTGAWSEIWRDTMAALAKEGFHAIAIDLPPFGYSQKFKQPADYTSPKQAARILGVLDALKVKEAVLVCHSVGCRAGVEALLQRPGNFSKAVLIDPALSLEGDALHPRIAPPAPNAVVKWALQTAPLRNSILGVWGSSPYSIKPIFKGFIYNKDAVTPERLAFLQAPLRLDGLTAAEGAWLDNLGTAAEPGAIADLASFKKILQPVLLIWGRQDTVTPLWQGEALQKIMPKAQLRVIDDAGHIPAIETPLATNAALLSFLKE